MLETSHTDLDSARLLAKQLEQTGGTDAAKLTKVYELISALDPFDAANHSALGRLKMKAGDANTAAREFRAAIAAGSLDAAAAHCDLAESYVALGDKVKAKREAIAAMEVAPGYPRAQDLLLKLVPDMMTALMRSLAIALLAAAALAAQARIAARRRAVCAHRGRRVGQRKDRGQPEEMGDGAQTTLRSRLGLAADHVVIADRNRHRHQPRHARGGHGRAGVAASSASRRTTR